MNRILLAGLLTTAVFPSFSPQPVQAVGEATCQERSQTMNKTEDGKTHRREHREQILNKQAESNKQAELTGADHRQDHRQQLMNKHICS